MTVKRKTVSGERLSYQDLMHQLCRTRPKLVCGIIVKSTTDIINKYSGPLEIHGEDDFVEDQFARTLAETNKRTLVIAIFFLAGLAGLLPPMSRVWNTGARISRLGRRLAR